VKSQRGTQFRIWANSVLKRYLTQGFAIKENATQIQLQNLSSMLEILSKSIENESISIDETQNLLRIIKDFSYGLDTLDKYDNQVLEVEKTTENEDEFRINYENASQVIQDLKKKFNARKGKVIAVVNYGDEQVASMADYVIEVPDTSECFSPIVASVPLQLLAYYIAVYRGTNVDQPRNLAKSVTVE
jgi:DNA-binding MurR/RpiR family transcriptional regulator